MKTETRLLAGGLTVCLLVSASPSPAPAVGVLLDNITQADWTYVVPLDINGAGAVVGYVETASEAKGFLYQNGAYTYLTAPGQQDCSAERVNSSGQVVGYCYDGNGVERGFLYSPGTYTTILPPGWAYSMPTAVSDSGIVAGYGDDYWSGDRMGFLYDSAAATYTHVKAPGCSITYLHDVNGGGQAVGMAYCGGAYRAFLYDGVKYIDVTPPGWTESGAYRINEKGDILGGGKTGGVDKCFLRTGGGYQTIYVPGAKEMGCMDLNNRLDVVGVAYDVGGKDKPFIYRRGVYHFMETGYPAFYPMAVNDAAVIAASGDITTMGEHALIGLILPAPDLKAGGSDGPISQAPGTPLGLTGAMTAFTFEGLPVDWWVAVFTPAGMFSYEIASRTWKPGLFPAAGLPLFDVGPVGLAPAGGPAGIYHYVLGVDAIKNGAVDMKFLVYDVLTAKQP